MCPKKALTFKSLTLLTKNKITKGGEIFKNMKSVHKKGLALKKLKGFTLIELLIVIAIVGVLAAIVLVALDPAEKLRQARDSGRKSDIGMIATSMEAYYTSAPTASYPGGVGCGAGSGIETLVGTGEMRKLPRDPETGDYCYNMSPAAAPYTSSSIYATLKSNKDAVAAGNTKGQSSYYCWQSSTGKVTLQASNVCAVAP